MITFLAGILPFTSLHMCFWRFEGRNRRWPKVYIDHCCRTLCLSALYLVTPECLSGQFQLGHLQVLMCIHSQYDTVSHTYIAHVGNSFKTHVCSTVNLMHLALSSPWAEPAKFFASSISVVVNWPGLGLVPEMVTDDPAIAQEMG
jgi:hypothetical protein